MVSTPIFKDIDEYGDLMKLEDFIRACDCGAFIDYDGCGRLATESQQSNVIIKPSEVKTCEEFPLPSWATHVVWYNK